MKDKTHHIPRREVIKGNFNLIKILSISQCEELMKANAKKRSSWKAVDPAVENKTKWVLSEGISAELYPGISGKYYKLKINDYSNWPRKK